MIYIFCYCLSIQNSVGWFIVSIVISMWHYGSIVFWSENYNIKEKEAPKKIITRQNKLLLMMWKFLPAIIALVCTAVFYVLFSAHPINVRIGAGAHVLCMMACLYWNFLHEYIMETDVVNKSKKLT